VRHENWLVALVCLLCLVYLLDQTNQKEGGRSEYPWLNATTLRYTLVCLVCLVCLVYLVSFVQPNTRDRPNRPNELDLE
jgi:hypothetical protein